MESSDHINRLRQGNEQAFKELFNEYYALLCQTAERYVGDRFHAEAITTDTIFCLWKVRNGLRDGTDIRAYLLKSVRNKCLNFLKSKYQRSEIPFSLLFKGQPVPEKMQEEGPRQGEKVSAREMEKRIAEALEKLPEKTGEVFRKSRFESKSYTEIACELDISINTVKFHMKKALAILKSELKG